jgi:hypothetical protein
MKLQDLPATVIADIKTRRYDRLIGKHEGPARWGAEFDYGDPELLELAGHHVLLPVDQEHHPHISVLRCIVGDQGQTLTLFLKDVTDLERPEDAIFDAGFLAICERVPEAGCYLTIVYHEWFIVEPV